MSAFRLAGPTAEPGARAVGRLLHGASPSEARLPHGPMLTDCAIPGCDTLTMGGTCVEHDAPLPVTFPRGRAYVPSP